MGWFKKATGALGLDNLADKARSIVDPLLPEKAKQLGTQTVSHAGSWAPQVAGAILSAAGMPMIGVPLAGLGTGIHSYQKTGNYGTSALQGALGAASAYLGGGAIKGFDAGMAASQKAGGGLLGQLGSGIQGAMGITPGAAKTAAAKTAGIAATNYPTYNGVVISTVPGAAQTATLPSGQLALGSPNAISGASIPGLSWGSNMGSSVSQAPSVSAPFTPVSSLPSTQTPGAEKASWLNPKTALGGASMLGSMIPKSPTFSMPDSVGNIRSQLMSGNQLTSLGKDAQAEISRIMTAKADELYPIANDAYYNAALKRTRDSYAAAEEELDKSYNLVGMYGTGEHMAAKADLKNELAQAESALAAQTEQQRFEMATNAKMTAIAQALNVDQATLADLVGLSGLDVQTAAMIYGANVEDVQQIRQALGTLGTNLISSGLGVKSGADQLISRLLGS